MQERNKQALFSLVSVLGVGLTVFMTRLSKERSGPTPEDARDMKAISQALQTEGPKAVSSIQVNSDVGREAKSILVQSQKVEEDYDQALRGLNLDDLGTAKTMGSSKAIQSTLRAVERVDQAAVGHTQGRDALFGRMGQATGDPVAFEAKVGALRKEHLALLKDERKVYAAARAYLLFAAAHPPKVDPKSGDVIWSKPFDQKAMDLEVDLEAARVYYDQQGTNFEQRRLAALGKGG